MDAREVEQDEIRCKLVIIALEIPWGVDWDWHMQGIEPQLHEHLNTAYVTQITSTSQYEGSYHHRTV